MKTLQWVGIGASVLSAGAFAYEAWSADRGPSRDTTPSHFLQQRPLPGDWSNNARVSYVLDNQLALMGYGQLSAVGASGMYIFASDADRIAAMQVFAARNGLSQQIQADGSITRAFVTGLDDAFRRRFNLLAASGALGHPMSPVKHRRYT